MPDFDLKAILYSFDQLGDTYLRDEVEEALQHREELTPALLKIIESVGENPMLYALEQRNAHIYAASLLAHFQEPGAHQAFIRAFSIPEEQLVDIWGDMTTETLPTLLYRTSGGSMAAIKALVTTREVDQYVRCAAMEALSYFVAFDPSLRDEVVRFCQGLFTGEEAERETYFWSNLAATLCDLHPGESMAILRAAMDDGLIHQGFIGLENIEEANAHSPEASQERLHSWVRSRMPADVHAYISWFAEFHPEEQERILAAHKKSGLDGAGKQGQGVKPEKKSGKAKAKKKRR